MRDKDCIRAVIRGTAANHDGRTTSITKPSGDAHASLIRETYQKAGLPLFRDRLFEEHGTGTPQGDPIEMRAIAQTVASARRDGDVGPLYVGSVKPNVGHTEGAAGLAGIIPMTLMETKGYASFVTFSGTKPSIAGLHDVLSRDGKLSRILRTGVAYHSAYIAVIAPDLDHALARLPERTLSASVPMYSSATEEAVGSSGLDRSYWVKNMLQPVRFAGTLQNFLTSGTQYSAILEIGLSKTLQGPTQQILSSIGPTLPIPRPYRSMLVAGQHAGRGALEAAGFLWATGHAVDLDRVNGISTQNMTLAILPHLAIISVQP
ncbi:thiolase-like protein [Aspergillus falconensis]